ncbi:MAG: hypothetical protein IPK48_07870 [Gammaproteobacteria bacterium]|nr:hypothetical protein [Gammaproteobacteria bacterium]
MAKKNPHITGCRVERPATLADSDLRRADRELLEQYQAVMRLIDGAPAAKRNLDQATIRDFVTGRSEQHGPMATRLPRYKLAGIGISIALVVVSIIGAVWLATT